MFSYDSTDVQLISVRETLVFLLETSANSPLWTLWALGMPKTKTLNPNRPMTSYLQNYLD